MVFSQINPEISYDENLSVDTVDKNTEVSLFKTKIMSVDVVIALGQVNSTSYDEIYYAPVYLIINDNEYYKIGVYEFLAQDYTSILDNENDIDISLLDEPLLFKEVTTDFLIEKTKDGLIEDFQKKRKAMKKKKMKKKQN